MCRLPDESGCYGSNPAQPGCEDLGKLPSGFPENEQKLGYFPAFLRIDKVARAKNDICFHLREILIGCFTLKVNGLFSLAVERHHAKTLNIW